MTLVEAVARLRDQYDYLVFDCPPRLSLVSFAAPDSSQGTPLMYGLSKPFTVPGPGGATALPAPSATVTVDGYTVTLAGTVHAGQSAPLTSI